MQAKTVVVTGASVGIGEELAVALAGRGANVVLAARGEEALQRVKSRCEAAGGRAVVVPTDVSDPEACRRLVERAVEAFGGIDVLVNNAGVYMEARVDEVTDLGVYEWMMRTNYLGAVYCTHHALPHLKARRGLVATVSSLTGKAGVPTLSGYAASKHALHGFFDSLRIELRGTGVDVTVVCPGTVASGGRPSAPGQGGNPPRERPEPDPGKMNVDTCVAILLRAIERREREVVMTAQGKVGQFLKLLVPGLVDGFAARAVQQRRR